MRTSARVRLPFLLALLPLASAATCPDESVTAVKVAQVIVEPRSAEIRIGETLAFEATVVDEAGTPLPGRTVRWNSSDRSIAGVDVEGLVEARSRGSVAITARSDNVRGVAVVTVR